MSVKHFRLKKINKMKTMALLFWTDFFYTKLTERYYEEHKLSVIPISF